MTVVFLETASSMKKTILFVAGISIMLVLFSGCIQENVPSEESGNYTIYNYSTPGFEINNTQASTVWEKVKFSDDAKFVTREKNYSVTVFVQAYAQGTSTTEWIVVASSIPKRAEDIKMVIFRLDYKTFGFKRSYYFSYPKGKELTLQQSIAIMEKEMKKEPGISQSINESSVALQDGNYVYSYLESNTIDAYLFSWDEIPGNDSEKLIEFLEKEGLSYTDSEKWVNIEKIANNGAIRVLTGENTVILSLNGENTKVNLRFIDGKTEELTVRMENRKLNIYGETNIGATIIFNKYAGRTIFHATRGVWISRISPIKEVSGKVIVPGEEVNGTTLLPDIDTRVESISSPAYRGTSTIVGLSFTAPDYVSNGTQIHVDYRTEMMHTDGSLEPEPEGFSIIPEKKRLILERVYLFSWDEIPGKDSGKLIEYLERMYFLLDWLKTAKIEKIDNGKTIRVFNEKDSILLKLNDEKTKIDLRTGVYASHELFVKMDNNKLRIYDKQTPFENGNGRLVAYSNLTVKTDNASVEGDYFITATARFKGWVVGKNVFSFKIGKGGKKSGGKSMTEGSQNIGYSGDNPPSLNEIEKAEMAEVALRDPYLKGMKNKLIGVTSEYLDLENYSGFLAVATVDVGDPDYPGETIRYFIDREEKNIIGSSTTFRAALEYFRGEAFDEAKGNFTKRWDAWNFPGLWLDNETNVSTETLVIDQSLLNNSYRVIDKHNLRYTTNMIPLRYLVYAQINWTPEGTDGAYQAIGWMGEKHVYLKENRLAKVIFEQNASEEKEMTIGESWELGEGYRVIANSISAKDAGGRQAWITLFENSNKLVDTVMVQQFPNKFFSYRRNLNDSIPNFMIYYSRVESLQYTDAAYFKYTWLRSNDTNEIKPGGIFGIMEVTSVDNGIIELRNREPIELMPDRVINLMGNLNIKVGSSNTSLSFYPYRVEDLIHIR